MPFERCLPLFVSKERLALLVYGFTTRCRRVCAVCDGFTTRCRKGRANRGEIFHGVVKGAQVRDGFTTWCSKGRASCRFLKKSVHKVDNVKYVFYLCAVRSP